MANFKVGNAMRFFLLVVSAVMWLGIWLTGVNVVHWVLYIPAVFFVFAGVTGICPGMMFSRMLFKG